MLLVLGHPLDVGAQAAGGVQGVVATPDGAPVAGAIVQIAPADGRSPRRTLSDRQGMYRFADLPPGRYSVTVRHLGYRDFEREWVDLEAGQQATLDITLRVEPVELEGVVVRGSRQLEINIERQEFGLTLDSVAVRLMPTTHDPKDLVSMVPGARAGHVWGGASIQANSYQIDGIAANHPGAGGDFLQPSTSWIERVEVRGLGAGAEHGNFQGGLINIVTRRGTNQLAGTARLSLETHQLNSSNFESTEIAREVSGRREIDVDVRGPIVRDRLFYFLSSQLIERNVRAQTHLERSTFRRPGWGNQNPELPPREFLPFEEWALDRRVYLKMDWEPNQNHRMTAVAALLDTESDRYGLTGYEHPDATWHYTSPIRFYNLSWRAGSSERNQLEVAGGAFSRSESRDPYAGEGVPGIEDFGLVRPKTLMQNHPLRFEQETKSVTGSVRWNLAFGPTFDPHTLRIGAEFTRGDWMDLRQRNGGMTWRPVTQRDSFDPDDPATWYFTSFIPSTWGGEVDLHAEVENAGAFAQSSIRLTPRFTVTPGLRVGRWRGWLLPGGDAAGRFEAVRTAGVDPRIGGTWDLIGRGDLVLKAHWGRYHQNMFAQIFDRAAGGDVFTNEEFWYYWGEPFTDPHHAFSRSERDALAEEGMFRHAESIILNQTGRVEVDRQPYVAQLIVGMEHMLGTSVKLSGVYVNRVNRQMVSLVDRNAATNFTRFDNIVPLDFALDTIRHNGLPLTMRHVYVRNDHLARALRAAAECGWRDPRNSQSLGCVDGPIPGLTLADADGLTYDPDFVLMNVPDARRDMHQLQLILETAFPTWGMNGSLVYTHLTGNLNTVSGYDDSEEYGPGPYVRPNEDTHRAGFLPNQAELELKVSVFGELRWNVRGGVFWTRATGDRDTPYFTLSSVQNRYAVRHTNGWLDPGMLEGAVGERVLIEQRGSFQHTRRANLDVRLERGFHIGGWEVAATFDVFNVFNFDTVIDANMATNQGRNFIGGTGRAADPNAFFRAVRDRVPPRTLRIGTSISF
jgi:hypothetical protein